ncbi:hypothetical protein QZH41_015659 [Actinostola sp. cb2023]|nr:hypothetical protein QZH41_015659 [Actinostola sp. cb2023]
MAASLMKFAVKCGVAGGIVYAIASLDVFSSQDRAITSFRELKKTANTRVPLNVPEMPSRSNLRHKWNSGVQTVFSYFEVAPDKALDASITAMEKTKDFVSQQLNK